MARRNKEIRAEEKEIQDGTRSPRSSARAEKMTFDSPGRLSKYARIPSSTQSIPGQSSANEGQIRMTLQMQDGGEEGAEAVEACLTHIERQDVRPKDRGRKEIPASLQDAVPEPTLKDVLYAVNRCNSALSSLTLQFEAFKEDITHVRHDIQKVAERATRMETRISGVEDQIVPLQRDTRKNTLSIAALLAKTDDLENRSRRNNVRIVGVPEKVEGPNPAEYFESWLLNVFGKETLSPLFAIERAHRVPMRPLPPGAPPRTVLIKLLHFKDRDV